MNIDDEFGSSDELRYLLRSSVNAQRLTVGIAQLAAGEVVEVDMAVLATKIAR
ncbi:type II toxin-antitoxin system Phd/YefM family antitoxin [Nocardia stercoris]|uniref:hypothetical protein n=1 Tax=Nocardia stercoris TaxID=2483361 RepID=UPI00131A3BE9|nr:hypothetical protein [Nocardia stercoris]